MAFIEYEIRSEALHLGERMKSGVFRPTCRVLRYSQVSGALRRKFGTSDLHAAGYLTEDEEHNQAEYLIYAPRDRATEISKIPLEIEVLRQVQGKVFVVQNETAKSLPEDFDLTVGGALSWGLGVCHLERKGVADDKDTVYEPDKEGLTLATRIPMTVLPEFGIRKVLRPVYGYLFEPEGIAGGKYILALFEGSVVQGPRCLLKKA